MSPSRSVKATLKSIAQVTFTGLWSVHARILGRLLRPRPKIWSSPGGRRILVVAPHPDDEVAGCAGALLAHRQHGDQVLVSVATDGRRSRALGLSGDEMAARRRGEMEAAASHLGVELEWIGLPEDAWRVQALEHRLAETLQRFKPDTIYAPSRVDFHPEHEKVARALGGALASNQIQTELRIYAVQVPLTPRLANLAVVCDLKSPRLIAAFGAHHSQRGSLERCHRRRHYAGRLYGLEGAAETFWRVTPTQYRRLHDKAPSQPLDRTFRGLRYYALSDPLAYLKGLGERRRLARHVMSDRTS